MDYQRIYGNLIHNARNNYPWGNTEIHHVVPTSMGGDNSWDNLVRVSPRLHRLLHLLLWRMGHRTQIFSVVAIMKRYGMKPTRMVRRAHNKEEQRAFREARKRGEVWFADD